MQHPVCPHCEEEIKAFSLPDNTGFQGDFHLACFNDECPYYQRGWVHMEEHYAVKASYRYRVDPVTGKSSPLAVWSPEALKDRILDAEITESATTPDTDEDPEEGNAG